MKSIYGFLFLLLFVFGCFPSLVAQPNLSYYLPAGVTYDPAIPTPKAVLGYEVGEWHVTHDQLVHYMRTLAAASDRITVEEYARTHENRPLLLLTVTSPENHRNLPALKEAHRQLTVPGASGSLNLSSLPAVVWMGYSVHGNEPSGSNASLLAVYHLAAAQGPEMESQLQETIILVDPAVNPDGLNRFASWVNTHRSKNLVTDPNSREFSEAWPNGRTNHYWFDLNRDWLPLQHPESKGRLRKFHEWKPNLLTDHHEMGTNASFFFQPGIPSRNHPLTPEGTYRLTAKIGTFHARALDALGSLYYTEESYDDFYYGKGSTYPDINGAVGILFEQASSRGHAQESVNGVLRFPFTIRNQFATTLSTLQAAREMREELLRHQRDFYLTASKEAARQPVRAYVFGSAKDRARAFHLAELIRQHEIDLYRPRQAIKVGNTVLQPDDAYVVPTDQPQFRLIQAMFEKRTSFQDSLFYDISAWTLPLAFNLEYEALSGRGFSPGLLGQKVTDLSFPTAEVIGGQSEYGYLFEWHEYYAPRVLSNLLAQGLQVRVATERLSGGEGKPFDYGSILVPVSLQTISTDSLHALLQRVARENGVPVYAVKTGLSPTGVKLGSPSFQALKKPEILMLVEGTVNPNDAGEVWHLLDHRFGMQLSLVPVSQFNRASLSRYTTLIMVDGTFADVSAGAKEKLRNWVQQGGVIVAMGRASRWLADNGFTHTAFRKAESRDTSSAPPAYRDLANIRGAQVIGGAIFQARLDLTHPLGYGYYNPAVSMFKDNTLFMEPAKNGAANPLQYTAQPLLSGYISRQNETQLRNAAAIEVSGIGSGRIISFTENPNFRAFWYGTNKLFLNSIFFGHIISPYSLTGTD